MVVESDEAFHLREPGVSYLIDFSPKNEGIGVENGYFWNTIVDISICSFGPTTLRLRWK
jgi:hypothetical protein